MAHTQQIDTIVAKPEHLIGISTGLKIPAFRSMYEGIVKACGKPPEVAVCGSQAMAEDIYSAAEILGYSLAIVLDDELSPRRFWLTNMEALSGFPGCGLN